MNPKTKGVIVLLSFFVIMIAVFTIATISDNKHSDNEEKERFALVGKIHFKGKVIDSKVYPFAGKDYYMVCVQLDTCNVKNFYVLNDLCALKIKNNIAAFSGSVYNPNLGFPTYIEINMKNDGKTKVQFKDGTVYEYKWLLHTNGLTPEQMNICN